MCSDAMQADSRQMALKDIKSYRNTVGRQSDNLWESVGSRHSKHCFDSRHKATKVIYRRKFLKHLC